MKKIISFILCSFIFSSSHAEFYFELGIGLTKSAWAKPEIDLQGPLGKAVLGVQAKDGWSIELEHISSIPKDETGNGLNVLWFTKRVNF